MLYIFPTRLDSMSCTYFLAVCTSLKPSIFSSIIYLLFNFSSLLFFISLKSTLLYSTKLYSTLLYSTLLGFVKNLTVSLFFLGLFFIFSFLVWLRSLFFFNSQIVMFNDIVRSIMVDEGIEQVSKAGKSSRWVPTFNAETLYLI